MHLKTRYLRMLVIASIVIALIAISINPTALFANNPEPAAETEAIEPIDMGGTLDEDSEIPDTEATEEEYSVRFVVQTEEGEEYTTFEDGTREAILKKDAGQALGGEAIPAVVDAENAPQLEGWQDITDGAEGETYTSEELASLPVNSNMSFAAVLSFSKTETQATGIETFGGSVIAYKSIAGYINAADKDLICVYPTMKYDSRGYDSYPATTDGLKQAIFSIYQLNVNKEYILYVGGDISGDSDFVGSTASVPVPSDYTEISLGHLEGRVRTLYITGSFSDPLDSGVTPPDDASTLWGVSSPEYTEQLFAHCNIVFRNINVELQSVYMHGYDITLDRGTNIYNNVPGEKNNKTSIDICGGVANGSETAKGSDGNSYITINSTGATDGITIIGGNKSGTYTGNTNITINDSSNEDQLINVYGGGMGYSSSKPAHLIGNTRTITAGMRGHSNDYYGGCQYGDVVGSITNIVYGPGKRQGDAPGTISSWYGGCGEGNVGISTNDSFATIAINNDVDFSAYGTDSGSTRYVGGNRISGNIYGSIYNRVKAGDYQQSHFISYHGGSGADAVIDSGMNTANVNINPLTGAAVINEAAVKNSASNRVHGNITNILRSGCFMVSNNSTRFVLGAGKSGYIEGSIINELGTDGLVYGGDNKTDNVESLYSSANSRESYDSGITFGGGGGHGNDKDAIFIKGDISTILHNVVISDIYNAGYDGVVCGNSTIELRKGIVDTLYAGSYNGLYIGGETHATIENGQIDQLLSGGSGMGTIGKNAGATVNNGIINGSVCGTNGANTSMIVRGDSIVRIFNGEFSGRPRSGGKFITGGNQGRGYTLSDNLLQITPTESAIPFKLYEATTISGGRGYTTVASNSSTVGSGSTNYVQLSINLREGDDLNGASLYGDGGGIGTEARDNNRGTNLIMTINAPGSQLGNVMATTYSHALSGNLTKNVSIKIRDAKGANSINGSGTNETGFSNSLVGKVNGASIHIGYPTESQKNEERFNDKAEFTIGNGGIHNFTELKVYNKQALVTGGSTEGSIVNSKAATHSNYYSSHNQYGDTTLENGASIGFMGAHSGSRISIGKLTFSGSTTLTSPSGKGRVMMSDFIANTGSEGEPPQMLWKSTGGSSTSDHTGTWFGVCKAYEVISMAPANANVEKITPMILSGTSMDDTLAYIGDNDVAISGNYNYGIALDASVIDFTTVEWAGSAFGANGTISHNLEGVVRPGDNATPPAVAYGTVLAGEKVQSGRLMIPSTYTGNVQFTFTPDAEITGSYVRNVKIIDAQGGTTNTLRRHNHEPEIINIVDLPMSYTIEGYFGNEPEVAGRARIIHEKKALQIKTADQIIALNEPIAIAVFGHNIDAEMIKEISTPLGEDEIYRVHEVTYTSTMKVKPFSVMSRVMTIVVVHDDSAISENESEAIYAKNASFSAEVAAGLTTRSDLDTNFTKAVGLFATGKIFITDITPSAMEEIKSARETKEVDVTYSYKLYASNHHVSKAIKVKVVNDYVCKIGNKGYNTLAEAFDAANAAGGSSVIEMLVDEYHYDGPLEVNTDKISITTASWDAALMPYKGEKGGTANIVFGNPASELSEMIKVNNGNTLEFLKVSIDGSGTSSMAGNFITNNGKILMSENAVIKAFSLTGSLIENNGTMETTSGSITNNTTTSEKGILWNKGSAALNNISLTGNKAGAGGAVYNDASGALSLAGATITGNKAIGANAAGGGIYQGGTLTLDGKVIVTGNTIAENDTAEGTANNVYLAETSLAEPLKNVVTVQGALLDGSSIGVTTDTSAQNNGKGILATIIAVPGGGYSGLKNLENMFTHDQLAQNANAYQVIFDQRTGGQNLVLGLNSAMEFAFKKVDMQDMSIPLQAEFNLYTCTDGAHIHAQLVTQDVLDMGTCWQPVMEGAATKIYKTDADGLVDFGALPNGTYVLVETKAPYGYNRPIGQWQIKLDNTKAGYERIGITALGDMLPPAFARNPQDHYSEVFLLPNMRNLEMVRTGGGGIVPLIIAGICMVMVAAAVFINGRRKGKGLE